MLPDFPHALEGREFVRDAPDRPARSVRRSALPVREDLRGRHRFVALAERAAFPGCRVPRIPEGTRALGPRRGEDDPRRRRVVLADFRHGPAPVPALEDIEDCASTREARFVSERVMGGATLSGPRREEEDFVFISRRRNARWSDAVRPGPVDGENGCNHRGAPRGDERDHGARGLLPGGAGTRRDRKSTRLNSSHGYISYAVFCLKKKKRTTVRSML